jgi:osmotically-inducible protein OsmY
MKTIQPPQREKSAEDMKKRASELLNRHHHFVGRSQCFEFQYRDGVLIVRGSVPTFYLKQVLQHVLKGLEGVRRIDNQVTVDASDGIIGPSRCANYF